MQNRPKQARWFSMITFLILFLLLAQDSDAKLVPRRDPRAGILDASLVTLVKHEENDRFLVEEVFLGESNPGDIIMLPDFKLFTYQQYGPDLIEPITPDTRILLFLQPKKEAPNAYEITAYGYCFFWVHDLNKVDDLRRMAKNTVELRKSWEAARNIPDESMRVEALWPYLWNDDGYFLRHTEAELEKTGAVAGDYIAQQFETLPHDQRMELVRKLGTYRSSYSHDVLIGHLKKMQQVYERFLVKHGPDAKSLIDELNTAPNEVKEIYGELYYGLAGLATFKDPSDLAYIRELALWAVKYRFKQTCDAALEAFQSMPDKANLSIIDSIWSEFSVRQHVGNEMTAWEVVRALHSHTYPESVPLLVGFLDDQHARQEAREALTAIVGKDLGKYPKAWLDWYKTQKAGSKL